MGRVEEVIVLDTHALIWWLADSDRHSTRARRLIHSETRQGPALVSTISLWEITTLCRRGRLELTIGANAWIDAARQLPEVRFEAVDAEIAQLAGGFSDALHGDPADRIILATAMARDARLVTADARLAEQRLVETVW